jgi:hypothetical protein
MPVDDQNFLPCKSSHNGKIDALILYGDNAGFHVFDYNDGIPPA